MAQLFLLRMIESYNRRDPAMVNKHFMLFSETGWDPEKCSRRTSGSFLQRIVGNSLWWQFYWQCGKGCLQWTRLRVCCLQPFY